MKSCALAVRAAASTSALRRIGPAEPQVVFDRSVEEIRVLRDDGDLLPNLLGIELAQIVIADAHGPGLRIVRAQEQAHDRRLARAARADDAHALARRHRKAEAFERGAAPARIGEPHAVRTRSPAGDRAAAIAVDPPDGADPCSSSSARMPSAADCPVMP